MLDEFLEPLEGRQRPEIVVILRKEDDTNKLEAEKYRALYAQALNDSLKLNIEIIDLHNSMVELKSILQAHGVNRSEYQQFYSWEHKPRKSKN